jgi:Flp pilus assembly pilin Flp
MTGLMKKVRNWIHDDQGVTSVEYAVMLALIIVVLFSTINSVGGTALNYFEHDAEEIGKALKF